MFKKGDKVIQILPKPREGIVDGFCICPETGQISILVDETGEDGVTHKQYFKDYELELK
jgi:hypothetical protein